MSTIHTVTIDGQVIDTRTSATRTYTHAVVGRYSRDGRLVVVSYHSTKALAEKARGSWLSWGSDQKSARVVEVERTEKQQTGTARPFCVQVSFYVNYPAQPVVDYRTLTDEQKVERAAIFDARNAWHRAAFNILRSTCRTTNFATEDKAVSAFEQRIAVVEAYLADNPAPEGAVITVRGRVSETVTAGAAWRQVRDHRAEHVAPAPVALDEADALFDDDEAECEGHESLDGANMGVTVYCDGTCLV
jgi:hypothetical protein